MSTAVIWCGKDVILWDPEITFLLGFGVGFWGLGFGAWGLGFRVWFGVYTVDPVGVAWGKSL